MDHIAEYVSRVLAWLSQGVNCVFLGGHHDQTVSARCYVQRQEPKWSKAYALINRVFFWEDDHCKRSYERDLAWSEALQKLKV